MSTGLGAFLIAYLLVFGCAMLGRATQRQIVIGEHYAAAMLTSFAIVSGEIAVIVFVVAEGWVMWPWIAAGAGLGGVTAMAVHRAIVRRFGR